MKTDVLKVACSNCNLRELCMPIGLDTAESLQVDKLVDGRRKIAKGQTLFRNGMPFESLFAIRSGVFKTTILHEDGREQVTGFQMSGEIIGLDGIVEDKHRCDSVALEDAEVCVIPFGSMEDMSREIPAVQHHVHRIMSREIVRENSVMLLLGNAQAEERLAAFFVNWGQRLQARGFSATELVLRMTRQDLGNYLGLKIETISRTLTKLAGRGILSVAGREIHILDMAALRAVASGADTQ